MTIREQTKAIKDCLESEGWKKISVEHLKTNRFNRSIKDFRVKWGLDEFIFVITITVTSYGIMHLRSENVVFMDTIKALDKALGGR